MKRLTKSEVESEIKGLGAMIKPNDTIYTILKHVSASGMNRVIDMYVIRKNQPERISWSVARALCYTYDMKREGIKTNGCGMDMGYHLVYSLGRTLWPDGTPRPHGHRNPEDRDGGYALRHRWL